MYAAKRAGGSWLLLLRVVDGGRRARSASTCCATCARPSSSNELELYYQPKIDARPARSTARRGAAALAAPERGMVAPGVFIPMAERFGLIGAIGHWVIEDACRQARAWRDQGLRMRVAINLSAAPDAPGRPRRPVIEARWRATGVRPVAADLRDHRVGGDGRHRSHAGAFRRLGAARRRTCRSTTSAPATPAWPTCASCRPRS